MPHETIQSRHLLESTEGSPANRGGGGSSHKRGKTNYPALKLVGSHCAGVRARLPPVVGK